MEDNYFEIIEVNDKTYWDSAYELFADSTLMNDYGGNFELFLGGYHLVLVLNKNTGECLSLIALLAGLGYWVEQDINIEGFKKGNLIYHSVFNEYGGMHIDFLRKFYCDSKKNLLCFGEFGDDCETIKFGAYTYAKVKSGKLYAIIIEVDKQIIKQLKKIVINSYKNLR